MSDIVYLTGKTKWAKLKDPDMKFGGHWTVDLYLDKQGLKNFHAANLELQLRESDEGPFIKLRRPINRIDKKKGELIKYDPPTLLDHDNKPLDVLVGNGSQVQCKLSVFATPKGNGHRLEAVRVIELVPYTSEQVLGEVAEDFVPF